MIEFVLSVTLIQHQPINTKMVSDIAVGIEQRMGGFVGVAIGTSEDSFSGCIFEMYYDVTAVFYGCF